jgi:hypothetical protein|tara:strand:+ start:265 stop:531 length:267 start_codon:yes stop_codon:yes gene_type:complete
MNNKYDIETGLSPPSRKVKGRYDDEHVLVDVPLDNEVPRSTLKTKLQNIHKSLVKGTLLSSEYTPINLKLKTNSLPARSSKCNNCIIS